MSHLSVDPCEVAVERRRVERGHSTEGAVDGRSDGLTGQGPDPVPHQRADRGLNDAVDVLHYKPLKLKSSMSLHDTYIFVFVLLVQSLRTKFRNMSICHCMC